MSIDKKKRIASLISNILNPYLVSLVVILLISLESASTMLDAIRWSLILVGITILPVFLFTVYLYRRRELKGLFTGTRKQRTKIYFSAIVCAVMGVVILFYFRAPLVLVAGSVAGLSAVVIFMVINLVWKISLHTAFIAGSVTVLVILYGSIAWVASVLLLLIGWARIELAQHSVAQITTGALLSTLVVVVVFYLFGLI